MRIEPLAIQDIAVDEAARTCTFASHGPLQRGARLSAPREAIAAIVRASSLFRHVLASKIIMLSPFELVLDVADIADGLLVPSALITVHVFRPWGGSFELDARVCTTELQGNGARIHVRLVGRNSVHMAARLSVCETDGFGIRHLRFNKLPTTRLGKYVNIVRAYKPEDMQAVMRLRRRANQFFGRQPDVSADEKWSDPLDASSVLILVKIGNKPVATGRVVFNHQDRALSEIEAAGALPQWLWSHSFAEVSRVAIDPDHRAAGMMIALFQEVGRLALETDCRYLVLDAIERLVPIYEQIGAVRLPLAKKHPFSDEPVYVMLVDVQRSLAAFDRRLIQWLYIFGPAVRHHLEVFGPAKARSLASNPAGFALKRMLVNAVRL